MKKRIISVFLSIFIVFQITAQWTLDSLSIPRSEVGSVIYNDNIYFVGGTNFDLPFSEWSLANKKIDIYNPTNGIVDSLIIPIQRQFSLSVVHANKLYVVGNNNEISIYDFSSSSWSSQNLIGLGDVYRLAKIDNLLLMSNQFGSLNLLDMDTDILTTVEMPEKTALVAMTACGGKFILAGGGYPYDNTDLVQIYDPVTDTWTTSSLSESKANIRGACRDGIAYFAGGETEGGEYTNKVEIFDVANGTWSIDYISVGRDKLTIKATENAVYIGGGHNLSLEDDYPTDITIFTSPTNSQTIELPEGRLQMGIIGFQDKVYFYGGADFNKKNYRSRIDIFDESSVGTKDDLEVETFNVFPNPVTSQLIISPEIYSLFSNGNYSIISVLGTTISEGKIYQNINITDLPSGNFKLVIYNETRNLIKTASFTKI